MIRQRIPAQTPAEEKRAYQIATERDEDRCQRCLRNCGGSQRHHRQPRDGRNTLPSNLIVLGSGCHQHATDHPAQALIDGWSVPRHTTLTPAEWPARRWLMTSYNTRRLAWVLLLNEPDNGRWWIEITEVEAAYRMKKGGA